MSHHTYQIMTNNKVFLLSFLVILVLVQGNLVDPPNLYILKFQYAPRVNSIPEQNKLNVIFNNEIIDSLNPTEHKLYNATYNILVEKGMNYLRFQGNGNQTLKGMSIDNVQLMKAGSTFNVLINGDFESPGRMWGLQLSQSIPGWFSDSLIKINHGNAYNNVFRSRVCWFGSDRIQKNYVITQNVTFDNQYNLIPPYLPPQRMILEVDWSRRQFKNASTSQGTISLNNATVDTLIATQQAKGVNYSFYSVDIVMGINYLAFDGGSNSDGFGISIGYVSLYRFGKFQNLIRNHDFKSPYVAANQTKFLKGGVAGSWQANNLQIGDCTVFNSKWRGGFCIELDSDKNQRVIQKITVDWQLYKKLRDGLPIS